MSEEKAVSDNPSRREAIKTALKVGAYAAPVILSVGAPSSAEAQQISGPTGTLTGTITSAINASPISGATVSVGGVSGQTNGSGVYSIPNAPSGQKTVGTSASGFTSRTDSVNIAAGGTTNFSTSLVPNSAGGNITIVISWAATPRDLDSHLTGPNGGGRFHCYYGDKNPVTYAALDIDDTDGTGPETIAVSTLSGNFVAGTYNYFIHNYANDAAFSVSNAVVSVFQSGAQIAQFLASGASGNPTSLVWNVFSFVLTATPTGQIVITSVQTYQSTFPTLPSSSLPPK